MWGKTGENKVLKVGIVGASGYVGGELMRLLVRHPEIEISSVSSTRHRGEKVSRIHPDLYGLTDLKFEDISPVDMA
ncbi:MAG TPA: hypothetical protein HA289_01970, partial [Ferroplasma sp.]|nr:hypothetical protein [Ferroplasma sp.]